MPGAHIPLSNINEFFFFRGAGFAGMGNRLFCSVFPDISDYFICSGLYTI